MNADKIHKSKVWEPPPVSELKWITNASKLRKLIPDDQFYVCRDSMLRLLSTTSKNIRDYKVLIAETLAIR